MIKMLVRKIEEMVKVEFEAKIGSYEYDNYLEKFENDKSDLDSVLSNLYYHSHNKSRDCDRIEITEGKALESVENDFDVTEFFEISDVDEKTYFVNIVSEL